MFTGFFPTTIPFIGATLAIATHSSGYGSFLGTATLIIGLLVLTSHILTRVARLIIR